MSNDPLTPAPGVPAALPADAKADKPKDGVKAAAGSVVTGALTGAVKGGGVQGALLGAGKALAKTKVGRRLITFLVVASLIGPIGGLLLLVNVIGAVAPGQQEAQVQDNSQQTVLNSAGIEPAALSQVSEASTSNGVPWQVVAALMAPAAGTTGANTGTAEVIVLDNMTCPPTALAAEKGLTGNGLLVLRCGAAQFPDITSWGGVGDRTNNPNSDHPAGRAVDAMIPGWDTPAGNARGWEMANWYRANADALHIKYVLFDQKQWVAGKPDWTPYKHPSGGSNPTLNHQDHVHVSVSPDGQPAPTTQSTSPAPVGSGAPTDPPSASPAPAAEAAGGWGPFLISPDAGLDQQDAQDLTASSRWISAQLAAAMSAVSGNSKPLGTGVAVLADGTMTVAVDPASATGAPGEYVNADMAAAAARTQDAWTAAIESLPVQGMSNARASQVFTTARNWYMGVAANTSVCVAAPGAAGVAELQASTSEGTPVTLNSAQLDLASQIIGAAGTASVGEQGAVVALMTALQESTLRNLANDGSDSRLSPGDRAVVMESLNYPNQGIASDWDSVNAFQQRPSQGWGTVAELMDPGYAAGKFFERLVAVPGWETLAPTVAAQKVQRSAYPDAYAKWEPVARAIVAQVKGSGCSAPSPTYSAEGWTYPLPVHGRVTSTYGPRFLFGNSMHNGTDLAVPQGTPILAAQAGVVVASRGCYKGCVDPKFGLSGWMIAIDHGDGVVTAYTHMQAKSPLNEGDVVSAGQEIGLVGMSGNTTGPHLHFSVFLDGHSTDPQPFMQERGVPLK